MSTSPRPTGTSLAAILLAALCVAAVAALHLLRADLDPVGQVMSEYANGPFGVVMTIAFYALALACLALGFVTSYARARAEGLGMRADVGIAERAERLVAVLVTTGFVGLGLPEWVLTAVLALLAVASLVTVVQRMLSVRTQARQGVSG